MISRKNGKDVKILPLSTSFYVAPMARQIFNVVSRHEVIEYPSRGRSMTANEPKILGHVILMGNPLAFWSKN